MKKLLNFMIALSLCATVTACSSNQNDTNTTGDNTTINGTYSVHIGGFDWGCGTSKAIVALDSELDSVSSTDFKVTETKQTATVPVSESETVDRQVTDAYLCDEKGNKVEDASKYVALELHVSPSDGSPLIFTDATGYNTWCDPYYLTITTSDSANLTSNGNEVTSLTIDTEITSRTTDADIFKIDSYKTESGVEYDYAYYEPEESSNTLFVWLHGLGEGGADATSPTDPKVTLLANKVTALAGKDFQTTLGGANILVPQSPTYWMDPDGTGTVPWQDADGTSYYIESLVQLIDNYKEKVGADKVVICGASNGGYMTMLLAINCTDKYDAYVPVCEALYDSQISDEDINKIKDLPIYFIYSEDDGDVDPSTHEIPTIQRLKDAGATNLHVSTSDSVVDPAGNTYPGHWSWIYFDNNETECSDCSKSAFDWIAETIK